MNDPFALDDDLVIEEEIREAPDAEPEAPADTDQLRSEVEALRREQEAARQAKEQAEWKQREEELLQREKDLSKKRREALETDDLDQFEQVDGELIEVRMRRLAMAQQAKPQPTASPEDSLPPAAQEWLKANPAFMTDTDFHQRVKAVNQRLIDAGMNVYHPRFYQELDRVLAEQDKPRAQAGMVAGVNRGARPKPPASTATRLTAEDLRSMASYHLDPDSPRDRRAWLNRNAKLA